MARSTHRRDNKRGTNSRFDDVTNWDDGSTTVHDRSNWTDQGLANNSEQVDDSDHGHGQNADLRSNADRDAGLNTDQDRIDDYHEDPYSRYLPDAIGDNNTATVINERRKPKSTRGRKAAGDPTRNADYPTLAEPLDTHIHNPFDQDLPARRDVDDLLRSRELDLMERQHEDLQSAQQMNHLQGQENEHLRRQNDLLMLSNLEVLRARDQRPSNARDIDVERIRDIDVQTYRDVDPPIQRGTHPGRSGKPTEYHAGLHDTLPPVSHNVQYPPPYSNFPSPQDLDHPSRVDDRQPQPVSRRSDRAGVAPLIPQKAQATLPTMPQQFYSPTSEYIPPTYQAGLVPSTGHGVQPSRHREMPQPIHGETGPYTARNVDPATHWNNGNSRPRDAESRQTPFGLHVDQGTTSPAPKPRHHHSHPSNPPEVIMTKPRDSAPSRPRDLGTSRPRDSVIVTSRDQGLLPPQGNPDPPARSKATGAREVSTIAKTKYGGVDQAMTSNNQWTPRQSQAWDNRVTINNTYAQPNKVATRGLTGQHTQLPTGGGGPTPSSQPALMPQRGSADPQGIANAATNPRPAPAASYTPSSSVAQSHNTMPPSSYTGMGTMAGPKIPTRPIMSGNGALSNGHAATTRGTSQPRGPSLDLRMSMDMRSGIPSPGIQPLASTLPTRGTQPLPNAPMFSNRASGMTTQASVGRQPSVYYQTFVNQQTPMSREASMNRQASINRKISTASQASMGVQTPRSRDMPRGRAEERQIPQPENRAFSRGRQPALDVRSSNVGQPSGTGQSSLYRPGTGNTYPPTNAYQSTNSAPMYRDRAASLSINRPASFHQATPTNRAESMNRAQPMTRPPPMSRAQSVNRPSFMDRARSLGRGQSMRGAPPLTRDLPRAPSAGGQRAPLMRQSVMGSRLPPMSLRTTPSARMSGGAFGRSRSMTRPQSGSFGSRRRF